MKLNTKNLLWIMFVLLIPVSKVFGEEGGEEAAPEWFPLLEVAGVVLGLFISGLAFKVYLGMQGGMIGEAFKYIVFGILSIMVGIATHGLNEFSPFMSEFGAEITLELAIYLGLILMGVGIHKVSKVA